MEFPERIKELPSEKHDFLSYCLKAEGCDVFFSEIKSGTFISAHDHEVSTLNFVAEGSITVEMDIEKKIFGIGEWCVIPKKVKHTLLANSDTRLIEFWFAR